MNPLTTSNSYGRMEPHKTFKVNAFLVTFSTYYSNYYTHTKNVVVFLTQQPNGSVVHESERKIDDGN